MSVVRLASILVSSNHIYRPTCKASVFDIRRQIIKRVKVMTECMNAQ